MAKKNKKKSFVVDTETIDQHSDPVVTPTEPAPEVLPGHDQHSDPWGELRAEVAAIPTPPPEVPIEVEPPAPPPPPPPPPPESHYFDVKDKDGRVRVLARVAKTHVATTFQVHVAGHLLRWIDGPDVADLAARITEKVNADDRLSDDDKALLKDLVKLDARPADPPPPEPVVAEEALRQWKPSKKKHEDVEA